MGFDNECILNIQTLAGEYFCPVCRLLVYPNEALQSQCTHLYCKPCLTYVVSTTKACPYDGYLVTEADSKPLIESNKTLAETIGKITVHCLYHRSGCTWQGSLSECTSHCSGCAFGNSPVVCNRCGIQIVHRQVQEHAQSCPGVQTQPQHTVAQDTTATGTAAASNQSQTATQAVTATSQAQTSQVSSSGQDPSLQTNSTTQPQAAMQAVVPTAEHWYQQQQQYQQYYQQYPGYDSYQQHYQQYYPYQQQTIVQYQQQPQAYMQPQIPQSQPQPQVHPQVQLQAQPQSHPQVQVPAVAQSQAQVNPQQPTQPAFQPQSQIQLQTQPTNVLAPQAQPHPQSLPIQPPPQQLQVPHYQQSHLQVPHSQPQSQAPVQGHSQHQPHLQAQPQTHIQHHPQLLPQSFASQSNQLLNPNLQPVVQHSSAKLVTGHNSFPQPQPHQQVQVGATKHPVIMHPQVGPHPQPHQSVHIQNQFPQQPPLLRPPQSHGIVQNMQQPGLLSSLVQGSNIPTAPQQPVSSHAHQPGLPLHQHPIMPSAQPSTHQQYVQQHQPYSAHLLGPVQNQAHQQGSYIQHPHVQAQLRPQGPAQSLQQPSNAYPQSQINVALPHGAQPVQDQNLTGRPMVPYHGTPYPQSTVGLQLRPVQAGATLQSGQQSVAASRPMPESQNDHTSEKGGEAESSCQKTAKKDSDSLDTGEVKTLKSESDLNPVDENRATREAKDVPEPLAAESEWPIKGSIGQKDVSNVANNQVQLSASEDNIKKDGTLLKHEAEQLTERSMELRKEKTPTQDSVGFPPHGQVQGNDQGKPLSLLHQRPVGPPLLQTPPRPPHHTQLPGHPSAQPRPSGPGHIPHPGQVLHQPPEHVQHPVYKQPHGPEISSGGIPGPGSTSVFGRGPSHYGHLEAPYNQGHGREPEMVPNAMRMNGAPVLDSSSTFGLRDDRFRPLPDEHLMSFPPDPTRRVIDREFEDLKHFPRPSHLDTELPPKFGSHFSLSKPLDRGPRGLGIDVNSRSLDKGHQLIPLGGPAPSSFFPHIHDGTLPPNDLVERPVSFQDNTFGRSDAARAHPDFLVPSPGYGRRHMDGLAQRSPGRDYSFLSSREFGAFPGLDDIDGRESRRFGGPFSTSVHDGRLPPRHLHRDEFEGLGHDGLPYYLRRGEHFGPRDLPNHLRLGEHVGFGVFPGHAQMGHLDGPRSFGHPRLGDPGYRSSFSMKGFPNDGGRYAGDFESFDNLRKRKPSSIGWCRICKVDCETVEGLDLHSQTREHQKMAMDMVITIKQNAKKQKLASTDLSSIDDASKSKTASFEGTGNKH